LIVIMISSPLTAFVIVRVFGYPLTTALTIAISIAQIGEFSFILAGLGVALEVLPAAGRDLILACALISIMANPMLFLLLDRLGPWLEKTEASPDTEKPSEPKPAVVEPTKLEDHAVLVGHGRVGHRIGDALLSANVPLFVIDEREDVVNALKEKGVEAMALNGVTSLHICNLKKARCLLVAIHENFEAGQIVEQARAMNSELIILARGHSLAEKEHLMNCGATAVVLGAEEIAGAMLRSYWTIVPTQ
jgi:CPA2 family monovalent cation:H+ antiporter-2